MICVDTCVLIWGVQSHGNPKKNPKIDKTRRYLEFLAEEEIPIMVPSPVVTEYLMGFKEDEHPAELNKLGHRFFLPSFDVAAATVAARLMSGKKISTVASQSGVSRNVVKFDLQVVATAIVHHADKIVTGNTAEFQKIAGDKLEVIDVPIIPRQEKLFPPKDE
jgi:predicted nucleic acid-binding protein